jgi:hypothetical protein
MDATALLQSSKPGEEGLLVARAHVLRCTNGHANVGIDMEFAVRDPFPEVT